MLEINNLNVEINEKQILNNISLSIKPGEMHVIVGPNGSGKSTFLKTIAGDSTCQVTQGDAFFKSQNLLMMPAEKRSHQGIFMSFQNPIEIPGISNLYFLHTIVNKKRKENNLKPVSTPQFIKAVKEKMKLLNMDTKFLNRSLNDGFSGGEKKRNEILQMLLLEPELMMLDEIDSGVDVDGLKLIAKCINDVRSNTKSFLIVTHYQQLLDYIEPTHVHIMKEGKIIKSGNDELIEEVHRTGFEEMAHE